LSSPTFSPQVFKYQASSILVLFAAESLSPTHASIVRAKGRFFF